MKKEVNIVNSRGNKPEQEEVVDRLIPWRDEQADVQRFKSGNLFVQAGVVATDRRLRRPKKT